MSQRARILPVRQKTNCKTQTTIFAKSTVSGLQVPSPSGTRVAKTPHITCRDSFRKPGPSCPALFFSLRTCKKSLRLAPAFAPTESVRSRRYLDASLLKEWPYRRLARVVVLEGSCVTRARMPWCWAICGVAKPPFIVPGIAQLSMVLGRLCDVAQLSFIARARQSSPDSARHRVRALY